MTSIFRVAAISAAVLLSASAAPALAQDAATTPASPPADASAVVPAPAPAAPAVEPAPAAAQAPAAQSPAVEPTGDSRISPPPAGKAQIVFFRQSKYVGSLLSFSVHEGSRGVGKLGNGAYFVEITDPGAHTYTIQSEVKDEITLEVDAGETYFVQQTIGMGIMMGRPHLSPSDAGTFARTKAKLSTKKPTDLTPTKAGS